MSSTILIALASCVYLAVYALNPKPTSAERFTEADFEAAWAKSEAARGHKV